MNELLTRYTLFQKIKSDHSEQGWSEYVHYYRAYILALLTRMNVRPSDLDDVLQEILIKCWKKLPELQYDPARGKFRSWLTVMTRNTVRDYLKSKAQRKRCLESDLNDGPCPLGTPSEIEALAEREWRVYVAELAWEAVSKEFKETLLQAFVRTSQGEKVATVATALGLAESSVSVYKKRVQRALIKEVLRLENFLG